MTIISGSAPASLNTLAVSYSQFVPGNTGIRTLGFAHLIAGETLFSEVKLKLEISPLPCLILHGKIGSSLSS